MLRFVRAGAASIDWALLQHLNASVTVSGAGASSSAAAAATAHCSGDAAGACSTSGRGPAPPAARAPLSLGWACRGISTIPGTQRQQQQQQQPAATFKPRRRLAAIDSPAQLKLRSRVVLAALRSAGEPLTNQALLERVQQQHPEAGVRSMCHLKKLIAVLKSNGWIRPRKGDAPGHKYRFAVTQAGESVPLHAGGDEAARHLRLALERAEYVKQAALVERRERRAGARGAIAAVSAARRPLKQHDWTE